MTHEDANTRRAPTMRVSADARFVVVDGRRTELSPAEAAMLSCLIAHAGEPVSRSRLHFALRSGSKGRVAPHRAVDFAIRRLRLKLEPDPAQPQMLFTVRGRGYRFVPPPKSEARARVQGPAPVTAQRLAAALSRPGGMVEVIGGTAPARGGLVRGIIDALGGPPPGGVLWVPGRFSDPDDLVLAVATACGPGLPVDVPLDEVLASRAETIVVIDAIATDNPDLLRRLRSWRTTAPDLRWVVGGPRPLPLQPSASHDLGPSADPAQAARTVDEATTGARQALAQLLATPGAVDVDLLVGRPGSTHFDDTVLDELDRSGMVRISGRGARRRATLITGATATVAATLSPHDQRVGIQRARQLVRTLVPAYRPAAPWDLLVAPQATCGRAVAHHPLLMSVVADAARSPRTQALELAVASLATMCGTLPRALMGSWLRSRGQHVVRATAARPRLEAMAHLALAWLEVPLAPPVLIGDPRHVSGPRRSGSGAADLDAAQRHLESAARIAAFQGLEGLSAAVLTLEARLEAARGEVGLAAATSATALLHHQICGDAAGVAVASLTLAELASQRDQAAICARHLEQAVPLLQTSGRPMWAAQAQVALGRLLARTGDTTRARFHLDAALLRGRAEDDLRIIAVAARLLAELEAGADLPAEASLRTREADRAALRLGDPRFHPRRPTRPSAARVS